MEQTASKRKTVLIVEDETALLFALQAELSYAGFQVLVASTGDEGLKTCQTEKPDLVVLDLMLPGKDGFAILQEMQKDQELAKIPVIVVSNLGEVKDIDRARALGARDYLVKSNYSLESIQERIKEILNQT